DGALRDSERLGNLRLAESDEVPERNDDPLIVRQLVHHREQLGATLGVEDGRLGGRGRVPRGLCCGRTEREVSATTRGAAAVVRLVDDDSEQPRLERRPCTEAAERTPRLDEAFLRGVLGFG